MYRVASFTEEQLYAGRTRRLRSLKESLDNSSLFCTANAMQILGYVYNEQNLSQPKDAVAVTGLQSSSSLVKVLVLNYSTHIGYLPVVAHIFGWESIFIQTRKHHLTDMHQEQLQSEDKGPYIISLSVFALAQEKFPTLPSSPWSRAVLPTLLGECMALLASGSDPTA